MTRIHLEMVVFDTFGWLFGVREFLAEVEKALPEAERREREALERLAREQDWDESDYGAARSEVDSKFEHWIPRIASYSLLTMLQMVIETQLAATAKRVREIHGFSLKLNELRGDSVERSKLYFAKVASLPIASDPGWQVLQDIGGLRDVIVHRRGAQGSDERVRKELQSIVARYPNGLAVHGGPDDPEAEVELSLEQCKSFLEAVEAFFGRLFDAAGLPRVPRPPSTA